MMMIVLVLGLLALLSILAYSISFPKDFPRNIPVVPLSGQLYDVVCGGASRADLYNSRIREPIEKHGAVAVWNEGKWTVLASRPDLLIQIFRNQDSNLWKIGFYHRTPWSSGGQLFGENIIDSDGELHAKFSKLLKPGILRQFSIASLKAKSSRLATQLWKDQSTLQSGGAGLAIGERVWQWAVSVYGEYFMDLEFGPLKFSETAIQQIVAAQNKTVIGRFLGMFPIFNRLPVKFPVSQRLYDLFAEVEKKVLDHARRRQSMPILPGDENKPIYLLKEARQSRNISEFHYRSNMKQLFVAGHENVETAAVSIILELAKNQTIQDRLYAEITQTLPANYTADDLQHLPLTSSVIYETLRLYPPLGTLTSRITTKPFRLGPDILLPPGIRVGWHAYGVHTDPQVWGESAQQFDPDRWGQDCDAIHSMFRNRQVRGHYIPFGTHSRRCLGSHFALTQLRVFLCEVVRELRWELPGSYKFSFSKAALTAPDDCTVVFKRRECEDGEKSELLDM